MGVCALKFTVLLKDVNTSTFKTSALWMFAVDASTSKEWVNKGSHMVQISHAPKTL